MTEDFEAQLKWFTKRLLQIRLTEVRGFSLPIPFELSDIEECGAVEFDATLTPQKHFEDLIEEIRGFYIKYSKNPASRDDIKLEYSADNSSVKIFGIDSDLLRFFLKERLRSETSLFEPGEDNTLFYNGIDTGVVLSATGQSILARLRLLKETDEVLPYIVIFEICAQHKSIERDLFRARNNTQDKKEEVARSAISYLLDKITDSELLEHTERDKIIENVRGKGYKLMM